MLLRKYYSVSIYSIYNSQCLQILKILPDIFYFSTMLQKFPPIDKTFDSVPTFNQFQSGMYQPNIGESYLFQVMNYQNMLNLELLKNQNLIANFVYSKKFQEKQKNSLKGLNSTSQGTQNSILHQDNFHTVLELKYQNKLEDNIKSQSKKKSSNQNNKIARKPKYVQSDQQYQPEMSGSQNYKANRSSESKNVPKNFSKAILLFIKRKQNLVKKLVEQEGVDFNQFMKMAADLKGNINTIAELRSLWIDSQNPFAKIFRIFSNLYMKRHSLQHIFNSRIEDFSKHLKYRHKISQVIRNPSQFTRMKDY